MDGSGIIPILFILHSAFEWFRVPPSAFCTWLVRGALERWQPAGDPPTAMMH